MTFAWFTNPSVSDGEVQLVEKEAATIEDFDHPDLTIGDTSIDVKGDTIHIATYTVDNLGNASLFDEFDVVNDVTPNNIKTDLKEDITIQADKGKIVVVSGITPDSVDEFTTDGAKVAKAMKAQRVSLAGKPAGIYLVKATCGKNQYYSKISVL